MYSNCAITSFKHLWFSRIFEVFNEMETNLINDKIFTKNTFKNKNKRERNFKIYHFLVESKPHERIDLLSGNIYQTKKSISIVIQTWLRKTDETIWESSPF